MTLQRRKPLGRGNPLARGSSELKRTRLGRGTKRLRAIPLDADERLERDAIRQEVFRRDGHRCQLDGVDGAGVCGGRLTFQHRLKDGQGGGFTAANGASLCLRHNVDIEADADLADLCRRRGLVLRSWQDPAVVPYLTRDQPTPETS